jgi:hypothetical protein
MTNISMHKPFSHLREIELAKLLETEPALTDSVCDFGYKVLVASGNRNMIMTFLEEFLWTTLIQLWDTGNLVQSPTAKRSEPVRGGSLEFAMKDKQLKSAQEIIKSLRSEISRLGRMRQLERSASVVMQSTDPKLSKTFEEDADRQPDDNPVAVDTPSMEEVEESEFFVEVGTCTDPEPFFTLISTDIGSVTDPDPLVVECERLRSIIAKAETDFHASTESVSGGDSEERPQLSETDDIVGESPRLALIRTRAEVVFEQVLPTVTVDDSAGGSSPMVSTERSRLADLKARELELMKEREIADELRIEELLREIVEKDEIIKTFHEELDRVRSKSPEIVIRSDEETMANVHVVSSRVVEERLLEIHELRDENTRLTNLVFDMEKRFTDNKDEGLQSMSRVHLVTENVATATDLFDQPILVKSEENLGDQDGGEKVAEFTMCRVSLIVLVATGQSVHEKHLEEERDREAARAARAIEETRKVKICLGELERQIAALQHQLRQSGVKQEHIESALASSGLVYLVKSNRVGVFERLYQDALERMVKMEKIRERFKEIQQRENERRIK